MRGDIAMLANGVKKKLSIGRRKILKKIIKKYKSSNEDFDCIVPVSGGKEGSYVSHTIKNKYKLRPLTLLQDLRFVISR